MYYNKKRKKHSLFKKIVVIGIIIVIWVMSYNFINNNDTPKQIETILPQSLYNK